jgi:hypothetical protein
MQKLSNFAMVLIVIITIFSCKSKPKVIVEDGASENVSGGPTNMQNGESAPSKIGGSTSGDTHNVEALEILQAERYTYMKVKENSETFWIAAGKFDPKIGNKYFYKGGLMKTNFESQEHKRVFDKIYLVSSIIDATSHSIDNLEDELPTSVPVSDFKQSKKVTGALKLSDLFNNKEKYSNKSILVSGKCVKANYEIMNFNWYHIQDGTKKDGKLCDFTITSKENIPLGAEIAFFGKITLNKDYGSGYSYDIIMEDGKMK